MSLKSTIQSEMRWLLVCILMGITGLTAYAASKFTPGKLIVILTGIGFLGFLTALVILAIRLRHVWRVIVATGISLLSITIGTYILLFIFVYSFQDTLANNTNIFFQPKSISAQSAQNLLTENVTTLDFTTPDGIPVRGWLVRNSTQSRSPLIIYFGGSGSESSEIIPFAKNIDGWSVALVNYRGFGLSEGTPTQSNVLADSLFVYDSLISRNDIDASQVVAMGYSLGTGVAVYLSDQRSIAGTILVSPYDYWSLIGVKQTPIFTPLSGVLHHYFNSISRASSINSPLLCLIGSNDTSIPPEYSHRLADAWSGKTTVIQYPNEDHGLLFHNNNSWKDVEDFLSEILHE